MHPVKQLKTKKGRSETGLFIVEGEKFADEIPVGWNVRRYYFSKTFADSHDISRYASRAGYEILRDVMFASLSDTETPQGILAVCEQRTFLLNDVLNENCFLILGENLSDPGNIGTLIRTAAAAGANGVILSKGSGDVYNPKTLRSSAGAALRLPVVTNADVTDTVERIKAAGVTVYAAHPRGKVYPYALDLRKSFCFMVGNEARGLTDEAVSLADELVKLPMPGMIESLNASVAGGVLMYEAVRQRLELS